MGTTQEKDFFLKVAMGEVSGMSGVNKFGHNLATTSGDDVWGGGGVYGFYPTSAVSIDIKSDDAADDGSPVGTGARTCIIYGLDENWDEKTSETITLNGTTEVAIAGTWMRIFRLIVLTAGSHGTNAGNLTVQCVGAGGGLADNTIGIYVNDDDGQTQQSIYCIPNGKQAYFLKGYVGMSDDDKNGEVAEFQWMARPNNGTTGAWAVKGEMSVNSLGAGHWQYEYGVPSGPIPEKTDIRIKVSRATATLGVVAGFDLILVDN